MSKESKPYRPMYSVNINTPEKIEKIHSKLYANNKYS